MSKTIRMLLVGVVGAYALSSTGTAVAAYTSPSLRVIDDVNGGSVSIRYAVSATDDPTAKLTFNTPTFYLANLSQAAGTTVGTVTAQGTAADLGGALLPLTGTIQVRATNGTFTSAPSSQPVPIAAAAQQCTGTPTHTAYWVLILQAAGQTLELPVFVGAPGVPPAAGTSAPPVGSISIQACLPPPDVPTGTPGRASFGFKLTQVDFKVNGIFTSPTAGQPRWRVLATPYTPNTGRPNAAGSVEAQWLVAFGGMQIQKTTLRSANGFTTLTIRGFQLLPAPSTIRLYRGKTAGGLTPSVTVSRSGTAFRGTLRIRQTAQWQIVLLQARVVVSGGTVTCTPTFGVPCLRATRAAVAVRSNTVRVVIPARKK